jgi:hypothetical protein
MASVVHVTAMNCVESCSVLVMLQLSAKLFESRRLAKGDPKVPTRSRTQSRGWSVYSVGCSAYFMEEEGQTFRGPHKKQVLATCHQVGLFEFVARFSRCRSEVYVRKPFWRLHRAMRCRIWINRVLCRQTSCSITTRGYGLRVEMRMWRSAWLCTLTIADAC